MSFTRGCVGVDIYSIPTTYSTLEYILLAETLEYKNLMKIKYIMMTKT